MDSVTNLKAIYHDRNSCGASTGPCTAGLPEQKHQAISAFCSVKNQDFVSVKKKYGI
jgi:hypothetical protein